MSVHTSLYRRMLIAYPAAFRDDYADELAGLFEDLLADARRSGRPLSVLRFWLSVFLDLLTSATRERMEDAMNNHPIRSRMTSPVLLETPLANLADRGKVRDLYDLGDRLLIVATDRISAFDVVLPSGIPGKGAVLTQLSAFWFARTAEVVPNHFLRLADGSPADELPFALPPELIGRSSIVRKAERLSVECIVRGYMAGSAWAEYQKQGTVCGVRLPPGIKESEPFPEPMFTPTTKADVGHDENLSTEEYTGLLGVEVANAIRLRSLALYKYGVHYARERGIIIADTKFEFGLLDGEPIVIDEILTPDSSRFWDAEQHEPGKHQEAFDKQFVRDWLLQSGWDREPPGPDLPPDVVEETARLYQTIYQRLTGAEVQL